MHTSRDGFVTSRQQSTKRKWVFINHYNMKIFFSNLISETFFTSISAVIKKLSEPSACSPESADWPQHSARHCYPDYVPSTTTLRLPMTTCQGQDSNVTNCRQHVHWCNKIKQNIYLLHMKPHLRTLTFLVPSVLCE